MQLNTLLLLLCCFLAVSLNGQGLLDAHFSDKKSTDIVAAYSLKNYSRFFKGKEKRPSVPIHGTINESIFNFYASYSATDALSLVLNVPYITMSSGDGQPDPVHGVTKVGGLQDFSAFAKLRFWKKSTKNSEFTLGGAAGINIPAMYEKDGLLSIGNGSKAVDALLLARFETGKVFFDVQGGYSLRTDFELPNALLFAAKVGYATESFYVNGFAQIQQSLSGPDLGYDPDNPYNGLFKTRVNFAILGLSGYMRLTKALGFTTSAGVLVSGRNIGQFSLVSVGLGYSF